MAIDKNSAMYKSILAKGYTDTEIEQMYNDVVAGKNAKDVVNSMNAQKASNKTSTNTPTNTGNSKSNTTTITYNGQVSDSGNKSGTSGMNSMSQSSAINNSRNAQVGTGDVVNTPKQQTTSLNQTTSGDQKFAQSWDSMSAAQQQNALSRNKALNDYIASKGLTVKREETPTQTTTKTTTTPKKTTTTPQQDQWDYQDNSQARMNEIARNLNGYRQTNPDLFEDMSAFYNFFIKDKGRSQDQIDFLWKYYDDVQKYGKYDNMSPEAIGKGLTDGSIPEKYLNYLKSIDPAKYQEVIVSRDKAQDDIKYQEYLDTIASMSGMEGYESEPSSIQYGKYNEIWMDEDNNGIDDRREHYASEEEKTYLKALSDLAARNLEIDNMVKHTYDDLVERYPGASKSTLMAMAQDTNADLLREKENNNVEMARYEGYVGYMQAERQEMNAAGADSIRQLQDNLGMYYDYSPQGMAELAQAKYGATNITLDQADSGNETQKQMALQSVLDDYYAKYGSIIQRSEQQVINDIIAYAKKNGVGLAQALQENFVKPLQQKPQFATLSSGGTLGGAGTDKWSVETIKDANGNDLSVMINQATGEIRSMGGNYGTSSTPGSVVTNASGKSYTVVSNEQLINGLASFLDGYEEGSDGGQCGAFVNNGLKKIGAITENIYDNSLESKLNSKNEEANSDAQTGWVAIYDPSKLTGAGAKHGHVGWVVKDNGDGTVAIVDSNGTKNSEGKYDETVGYHPSVSKSSLYGYFNPTKGTGTVGLADNGDGDLFSAKVLSWIPTQLRNTDVEKQWYLDIAEKQRAKGLSSFETAMSIMGFDITNNSPLAQTTKQKILDATMAQGDEIVFNSAVLSSMAQAINKGDYEKALLTLENQLGSFMSKSDGGDLSRSTVSQGIKAIDSLNGIKGYKNYAKGAWNTVADLIGAEGKNTASFNIWTNNVSRALRGLGYEKEEIDEMLPKLTNDKATFNNRVSALEEALLGQYNTIRRNHNLPSMTKEALLGNQSLYDIYRVWDTEQLRSQLQNAQNRNVNLRYGQPTTITAEAIKII